LDNKKKESRNSDIGFKLAGLQLPTVIYMVLSTEKYIQEKLNSFAYRDLTAIHVLEHSVHAQSVHFRQHWIAVTSE
jgi:hypothetical protein